MCWLIFVKSVPEMAVFRDSPCGIGVIRGKIAAWLCKEFLLFVNLLPWWHWFYFCNSRCAAVKALSVLYLRVRIA